MNRKTGIEKAVEFAGGIRPLGRLANINKSQIDKFYRRGWVAPERCIAIHDATGIPLHQLNPKIYPHPNKKPEAQK